MTVSVAVLRIEASRIALLRLDGNERSPTLVYATNPSGFIPLGTSPKCDIITYPWASTVAQSLTVIRNFARISIRQESARINAFLCIFTTTRSAEPQTGKRFGEPLPTGVVCDAVCIRKVINNLENSSKLKNLFEIVPVANERGN